SVYCQSEVGKKSRVLGASALSGDTPVLPKMSCSADIYHRTRHPGPAPAKAAPAPSTGAPATAAPGPVPKTATYKDEELVTCTQDFLNYFHQLHSFHLQCVPLIQHYEESSATAQKSSLALLMSYYANPPSPPIVSAEVPAIKKAFEDWLRRRLKDTTTSSKKLIQDLSTALGIGLSGPSPGSTPTPAPTSGPIVPGPPH